MAGTIQKNDARHPEHPEYKGLTKKTEEKPKEAPKTKEKGDK